MPGGQHSARTAKDGWRQQDTWEVRKEHPLRGQRCGLVVAMRHDRVLYRAPTAEEQQHLGPRRKHGRRFAFKKPETWEAPDEFVTFVDERWGQVELRRWNGLQEPAAADAPLDILQARIHLEREKAPDLLWLAGRRPLRSRRTSR